MEDVWKDINPSSSLQEHSIREELGIVPLPPNPHHKTFRGINLQEFLARPFSREPAPSSLGYCTTSIDQFGHIGSAPQPPPTYLCLNLDHGSGFPYFDNNSDPIGPHPPLGNHSNDVGSTFVESLNNPFDAFGSCSAFSPFGKKRGSESKDNTGDRRHKRMIKNRESASRSRARKQEMSLSSSPPSQIPSRKTMEDVWKDINPSSSLQEHSIREELGIVPLPPNPHHKTFRGINLQEFLARPFSREPAPSSLGYCTTSIDQFGHIGSAPQPPPTYLCLNLDHGSGFPYFDNNSDPIGPHPPLGNHSNDVGSTFVESLNNPFDAFGSCSAFSPFGKKRGSESKDNTGDRRHKRMIKNRESASRSRARKQEMSLSSFYLFQQSYTTELENKVDYLSKENERLQRQHQELIEAVAAAQEPKKRTLQRTSTAPF
ncbi:Fd-like [Thalictrum thalictroides]|uniref:Fd-like n=1 Tax=Thalictrum thalictroides TaxID=46969 RepID=A0A7J6VBI0_THATH|nr:Fd-like [Thalictrum thalictroides]